MPTDGGTEHSRSLSGTLAPAGPDCQALMLDDGTKRVSLSGVPGFEISFASLSVTLDLSTSGLDDDCEEGAGWDRLESDAGIQQPR